MISYGPCQFPTLGFVVDRQWQIDSFQPRDFWYLELDHSRNGAKATFKWARNRVFDPLVAQVLQDSATEAVLAEIVKVDGRPKSKWRPKPLATIDMQKLAARKLRMSSNDVMEVAESLYQKGFLSYPRTETDIFPTTMDLRSLVRIQAEGSAQWSSYAANLLNHERSRDMNGFQWPRSGRNDDKAHPPIHPTKLDGVAAIEDGRAQRLYELVARHFLACCSCDAVGDEMKVEAQMGTETFMLQGLTVRARNYLEVYPYENWIDKPIPTYQLHEKLRPDDVVVRQSRTQPPPPLSEADLLSAMDKHNIGTDATMHEHILKIKTRQYARQEDMCYRPNPLGKALIEGFDAMSFEEDLSRPELRAAMERDMKDICRGLKSKEDVVQSLLVRMTDVLRKLVSEKEKLLLSLQKYFGQVDAKALRSKKGSNGRVVTLECGCGEKMTVKSMVDTSADVHREQLFTYCPKCKTRKLPPPLFVKSISSSEHRCPICRCQVVEYNSDYGATYTCPQCFERPPSEALSNDIEDGVNRQIGGMRCKECSFERCPLAKGTLSTPLKPCETCPGFVWEAFRSAKGSLFIRCSKREGGCGTFIALPQAKFAKVCGDSRCSRCRRPMMKFVFADSPVAFNFPVRYPVLYNVLCPRSIVLWSLPIKL